MAFKLKLTSWKWLAGVDAGAQGEISNVALVKRAPTGDEYTITCKVGKLDETLGVVFGYAFASTLDGGKSAHVDLQDDAIVGGDELIKVALGFVEAGAQSDVMHSESRDGYCPFVMPLNAETKAAFKLSGGVEGVAIGMKPSPETFKRFVSGELQGFSIGGSGIREPIPEGVAARAPSTRTGESPPIKKSPNVNLVIKETAVDPTQELADLKALKEKLDAKIAELETANTELKAAAELTDGEKAHMASLSATEAKRFRSLEKSARAAEVAKANEADAVVVEFNGQQYRKSAGPAVIELAKAAKAQAEQLTKQADDIKKARIRKMASEILKNAPGDNETHDFIVEQIEGNEKALATLKGLVATSSIGKSANGFDGGKPKDDASPQAELDTMTIEYAKQNKVDRPTARVEVMKTAEGRRLYAESVGRA